MATRLLRTLPGDNQIKEAAGRRAELELRVTAGVTADRLGPRDQPEELSAYIRIGFIRQLHQLGRCPGLGCPALQLGGQRKGRLAVLAPIRPGRQLEAEAV